jgi:hypothetical protein
MNGKGARPGGRGARSERAGGVAPGQVAAAGDAVRLKKRQLAHAAQVYYGGSDPRTASGRGESDLRRGETVLGFQVVQSVWGGAFRRERGYRAVGTVAEGIWAEEQPDGAIIPYTYLIHKGVAAFPLPASPSKRPAHQDCDSARGRESGVGEAARRWNGKRERAGRIAASSPASRDRSPRRRTGPVPSYLRTFVPSYPTPASPA